MSEPKSEHTRTERPYSAARTIKDAEEAMAISEKNTQYKQLVQKLTKNPRKSEIIYKDQGFDVIETGNDPGIDRNDLRSSQRREEI